MKQFIIEVVKKTLNKNSEYTLVALDAQLKEKEEPELCMSIQSIDDLKNINQLKSFSNLALYQYTPTASNHINVSQNDGVIILIAKFMGPEINHQDYFDFAVHLDPIHDPLFTNGSGVPLNCSDMLKLINKEKKVKDKKSKAIKVKPIKPKEKISDIKKKRVSKIKTSKTKEKIEAGKKQKTKSKNPKAKGSKRSIRTKTPEIIGTKKIENVEISIYEKLKEKNAMWAGAETKTYQDWKNKSANRYRKESGKTAYYKGQPTNGYIKYLEKLSPNKKIKVKDKKPATKKKPIKKTPIKLKN
jgi:hypothetical protein